MTKDARPTRRLVFGAAGAVVAAPIAAAAPAAASVGRSDIEARLALLEDMSSIRELQTALVRRLNAGRRAEVAALFAHPGKSLDASIVGLSADPLGEPAVIDIAEDRLTARARASCTVRTERPIEPRCSLVDMAREQGEGVVRRADRGELEATYVKIGGDWKIASAEIRPL
jgi:hypothetical protein